jgi:hypothetical protein
MMNHTIKFNTASIPIVYENTPPVAKDAKSYILRDDMPLGNNMLPSNMGL